MTSQFESNVTLLENADSKIAEKRWRVAYTAIHFPSSIVREIASKIKKVTNFAQKRWRLAYATIHSSSRPMLSSVQDIVPITKNNTTLNKEKSSPPDHHVIEVLNLLEKKSIGDARFNGIDKPKLAQMVKRRDLEELERLGGVKGLSKALQTDPETGINDNDHDFSERKIFFGSNTCNKPPPKGLLFFVYGALKDFTILISLECAFFSLGRGIIEHGSAEGWYEGGSLFLAFFLVIVVSALINFKQERQFHMLSKISGDIKVNVSRNRKRQKISIFDIVVGDVVHLMTGDQIPADGVFLNGYSLQIHESSMMGESDYVVVDAARNPFLLSGSKVTNGCAQMVVTSVGMNTVLEQTMSSITHISSKQTSLQARLEKLTSFIWKVGLLTVFPVLVVLLVRYFTGNTEDEKGNREFYGGKTNIRKVNNSIVRMIFVALTMPEGFPLTLTLTLAYSIKRIMADQATVRRISACETMGSATVICTDKTGTLTMNQMTVAKFFLGQEEISGNCSDSISPRVRELFYQGVGLNTSGSIYQLVFGSEAEYSGSPTEEAIRKWAVSDLGMDMDMGKLKQNYTVIHVETFNSDKKRSGVLMRDNADSTTRVHWKGAAEMVLSTCSNYCESGGNVKKMGKKEREQFQKIIQGMAASSLRCIAFAHKQVAETNSEKYNLEENKLTLLGIVGLKDPCRSGVKKAIEECRLAGVDVKMITGDNVFTAKAIAAECGILEHDIHSNNDGSVVEGIQFRNYTHEERLQKCDEIRVMARSSPLDKLLMVRCLKQKGHVVAVTGDDTNDAPALKEADVGLSMGIQGTEVAKESSHIVILDDDFASIATVLRCGRCVYNNVQKCIQFQLTVNVAALVINFIAIISSGDEPLTTVQLLWVHLIMDTLGSLALATEKPTNELIDRPPVGRTEPLITNIMWRNLLSQALYQIVILLTLQFKGRSIFNVSEKVKNTLIFNTFVLCQVFNEFNSRELEKKDVFKGLSRNRLFIGIVGVAVVLQVVMIEFLKKFADTERLNWWQWATCIGIAALTWPIGWVVKSINVPKKFTLGSKLFHRISN